MLLPRAGPRQPTLTLTLTLTTLTCFYLAQAHGNQSLTLTLTTLTCFYLAQAHGNLGARERSASYCHRLGLGLG